MSKEKAYDEARRLLAVWFWEMAEDDYDGTYDCTCAPGDRCPLHRVATWLVKHARGDIRKAANGVIETAPVWRVG